jgi:hypothetical protein
LLLEVEVKPVSQLKDFVPDSCTVGFVTSLQLLVYVVCSCRPAQTFSDGKTKSSIEYVLEVYTLYSPKDILSMEIL